MRINRHLPRGSVATVVLAFAAIVACSGGDRSGGVGGDGFKPPPASGGPCTPGQVRDCGIELGRSGSVVDCAKGTQTCQEDKSWGTCIANGTTFKSAAPLASKGSPDPDLNTNAVGGSATTCADNPCNPYCKTFNDVPEAGITADATTTTIPGEVVSLADSNVPGGFQNKGTLDSQCTGTPGSLSYRQACQFDMRCGTKADGSAGCVAFTSGEKNACTGVDITAPPVCVPAGATTYRNLTVCNRGSSDLTSNLQCMGYPGNSPQFPDDNPGAGQVVLLTASTVDPTTGAPNPITAAKPLKAGECRTYRVPNGNFQSNGTMSIMCNPPATAAPVTTTLFTIPTKAETLDFATPDNALSELDSQASATTAFEYKTLDPIVYATGATNLNGFVTAAQPPSAAAGAPNDAPARGTLTTVTSAEVTAGSVANVVGFGRTWVAGASFLADTAANGGTASFADVDKTTGPACCGPILRHSGWVVPGATGSITNIDVTTDLTLDAGVLGYLWLRKADGTLLAERQIYGGTNTYSTPLAPGVLDAADLGGLRVEVEAWANGWMGGGLRRATLDYVGMKVTYTNPAYASLDATGYQWTAPPAGTYLGLEFTARARASVASGASLYVYAKRPDGTTIANAVFPLTNAFPASPGTAIVAAAPGLTAADLTTGFKIYAQAYPSAAGASVDLDSIGVRPIYRAGNATRKIRFRDFGLTVPAGASNVRLTTLASYKIDPQMAGDWISGTALSISGATTTLISTSSAAITNNAFTTYQLGAQTITDFASIEDPKLVVDVEVGKGSGSMLGTSTGSLDYLTMRLQYENTVGGSVPECNPSNNWTVNKANPSTPCAPTSVTTYPEWTVSRVFEGVCPVGSRPKWKYMGYTSTTPAGTKIEFRFRASARDGAGNCPTLAAVTTSPPVPLATAQLAPDTQVCSLTAAATATCPVNLTTGLGTANRQDCLQMDAHGVPAPPPTPASPTLTDWRVTYDCIPEE